MACLSLEELALLVDGVAPAQKARIWRQHLTECPRCTYEAAVAFRLVDDGQAPPPPPDLVENVLERLRNPRARPKGSGSNRAPRGRNLGRSASKV